MADMRFANLRLLRVFVIIFGIGLAMAGFYGIGKRTGLIQGGPRTPEQVNAKVKKDGLKILNHKGSSEQEVALALIRLGSIAQPEVREEALKRVDSKSPSIRRSAALALAGFTDPQVIEAYRLLLKDPEEGVRMAALQALGAHPSYEKEALLSEVRHGKNVPIREKIAALASFLRIAASSETQQQIIAELLKLYQNTQNEEIAGDILSAITPHAGGNQKIVDLLRTQFKDTNKAKLSMMALRTLALRGDPWLRANLKELLKVGNLEIRLAMIEMVPLICPLNRYELLDHALTGFEDNQKVIEILKRTIEAMPGEPAKEFLEKMALNKKLSTQDQKWAAQTAEDILKSPVVDKCEFIDVREEAEK